MRAEINCATKTRFGIPDVGQPWARGPLALSPGAGAREDGDTQREGYKQSERANKAVRVNVWFTWKCSGSWTANLPLHLPSQLRGLGITTTGFRIYVFLFFLHIFPAQTPLNSPIPLPSLPLFTEPGRMLNSPEAKTYLRTAGCDLFI